MLSLFTTPNATSTFSSMSPWSSQIFDNFYPVMTICVGLVVGGLIVSFLMSSIFNSLNYLLKRKDNKYDE